MLPLDSLKWTELYHAYGSASDVPKMLSDLRCASDEESWNRLLWYDIAGSLCHQGTVYTATYAAVPHLTDMLNDADEFRRFYLIILLGWISASTDKAPIPKEFESDYKNAIDVAAKVALELLLSQDYEKGDYIYLLQSVAGLHSCQGPDNKLETMVVNKQYEVYCPFCREFLVAAIRESGFYVFAATTNSFNPLTEEIEVKLRNIIDEDWKGVINCQDSFGWLFSISRLKGHHDICLGLRCLYGDTTCPRCKGIFNLMESFSGNSVSPPPV